MTSEERAIALHWDPYEGALHSAGPDAVEQVLSRTGWFDCRADGFDAAQCLSIVRWNAGFYHGPDEDRLPPDHILNLPPEGRPTVPAS